MNSNPLALYWRADLKGLDVKAWPKLKDVPYADFLLARRFEMRLFQASTLPAELLKMSKAQIHNAIDHKFSHPPNGIERQRENGGVHDTNGS